ncbi:hypothetical protein GCM10010294_23960 [Streptomyces griseoloalbus]|nr:hypothetical protein GCM10010294_23960 [Streptomyces griseoloalbus]
MSGVGSDMGGSRREGVRHGGDATGGTDVRGGGRGGRKRDGRRAEGGANGRAGRTEGRGGRKGRADGRDGRGGRMDVRQYLAKRYVWAGVTGCIGAGVAWCGWGRARGADRHAVVFERGRYCSANELA